MPHSIEYVDVFSGRLEIGARVALVEEDERLPQYVTDIILRHDTPFVELNRRNVYPVVEVRLLAVPDPVAVRVATQSRRPVLSGQLEVRLPWECDRIYFVDSPAEAIALLALKIGVSNPDEETGRLTAALAAGRPDEIRLRGSHGLVGQLAYVSLGKPERVPPRANVGDLVQFELDPTPREVTGVYLCANTRATGGGWQYEFTIPCKLTRISNFGDGGGWDCWHYQYQSFGKLTRVLSETAAMQVGVAATPTA